MSKISKHLEKRAVHHYTSTFDGAREFNDMINILIGAARVREATVDAETDDLAMAMSAVMM